MFLRWTTSPVPDFICNSVFIACTYFNKKIFKLILFHRRANREVFYRGIPALLEIFVKCAIVEPTIIPCVKICRGISMTIFYIEGYKRAVVCNLGYLLYDMSLSLLPDRIFRMISERTFYKTIAHHTNLPFSCTLLLIVSRQITTFFLQFNKSCIVVYCVLTFIKNYYLIDRIA